MLQPRQHDLLARLLNLPREEHLVQNSVDLVKVEDEVQLADVAEEGVEHLDEEVDGLEEGELVVVCVDAGAKEEPGVAAVDDLVVAELDKVGLVLLVAGRDEPVDFALELDLLLVAEGGVPLCETGFAPGVGVSYMFARGGGGWSGTDWRFWMRIKDSIAAKVFVGRFGDRSVGMRTMSGSRWCLVVVVAVNESGYDGCTPGITDVAGPRYVPSRGTSWGKLISGCTGLEGSGRCKS